MRVGATVRRWWLEPKNAQRFHVEAVRTFVGAKPVVVEFTATLDTARPPQLRGQPQMRVVSETHVQPSAPPSPNGVLPILQRPTRKARRTGAARARAGAGARRAAEGRPRNTRTRTRHTPQVRSRSQTRR
jgi:hypothetical protein